MAKFKVGDRVVVRNYLYGGREQDMYGTLTGVSDEAVTAENWTVGCEYGPVQLSENDIEVVPGFDGRQSYSTGFYKIQNYHWDTPIMQTKTKTFMKKLSNFITKTVDPKTQLLLKAGLINGDLEPTDAGRDVLTEILWFQNLEQIATRAQEIVTENEKESK